MKKLLVTRRRADARALIDIFNLDRKEWDYAGVGQAMGGTPYEKIVLLEPLADLSEVELDWFRSSLWTCAKDGRAIVTI
jgi:hypothetical protein